MQFIPPLAKRIKPFASTKSPIYLSQFYFKELKFFADLVIVEMDMTLEKKWLSEKMTDIAAIIEFLRVKSLHY